MKRKHGPGNCTQQSRWGSFVCGECRYRWLSAYVLEGCQQACPRCLRGAAPMLVEVVPGVFAAALVPAKKAPRRSSPAAAIADPHGGTPADLPRPDQEVTLPVAVPSATRPRLVRGDTDDVPVGAPKKGRTQGNELFNPYTREPYADAVDRRCAGDCRWLKHRRHFSKNQWFNKGARALCKTCLFASKPTKVAPVPTVAAPAPPGPPAPGAEPTMTAAELKRAKKRAKKLRQAANRTPEQVSALKKKQRLRNERRALAKKNVLSA